ncbi:hypothetical protein [Streptomyces sp. XY332]|uniref:hypothetical protein n=1 Tax=Streptomyces sp. XY332 TaxID=1415561 RepID=UPI000B06E34E|nr:hypothetical protein [Streptomyces sp. XY332]
MPTTDAAAFDEQRIHGHAAMRAHDFQPGHSTVRETAHTSEAVPPQIDETALGLLFPSKQSLTVQRHLPPDLLPRPKTGVP